MTLAAVDGRLEVRPRNFPTNKGGLCRKGWTAATLIGSPDRLLTPMLRQSKQAPLEPCSWDEALGHIVTTIDGLQAAHGKDAVGVYGGGGLTHEKAYMLGKFARVGLGTKFIDYNGRFCMASAAAGNIRAFGVDRGLAFPVEDIASTKALLLVGANPAETMPPLMQYFEALRANGGTFIVVDPRRTATAAAADLHLQPTPGTDAALANGLLHVAIRDGLIDRDFIEARTNGFEPVRRIATTYWPDRVERITGISAPKLEKAAHILGEAASAMVLTARGPEQQSHGVDNVLAFINLALALGHAGKPHSGYGCLTGQGNGQGGREHGQKADQLPGYRRIDDPAHRASIAAVWGIEPDELPGAGVSACEMFDRLGPEGGIRALLVMGSNPVVSAPDAGALKERLRSLDLLVVADPFLSETAEVADVVLPVTQWAEEHGTMTNLEGRVILRRKAVEPPPEVHTDAQVMKALADGLGRGRYFTDEPAEIFHELRRASAGGPADYGGVSYERIAAEDGVFWPCPSEAHAGTPRMFLDRFGHPDGRARFHAVQYLPPAEEADREFPFVLTTGRVMSHYQSGTQTRRIAALVQAQPEPFVEIHPAMARGLGVEQDEIVRLVSRRGEATLRTRYEPSLRLDTVFVPFHWGGEGSANRLTNPALDPVSKIPEFKTCAVRLEKLELGGAPLVQASEELDV